MLDSSPVVFVVDDDDSVRRALELLIESAGWRAVTFASAREFLAAPAVSAPRCLVLDFALPELDGLELQARIAAQGIDLPIIFITGHGDVPTIVRAMKAGALEFLAKPFDDGVLLRAIEHALGRSRATLRLQAEMQTLRDRHASLSRRQRQVMALVCVGRLNKQVACELGISEITVKAHRGEVMRKMNARTLADLITIAAKLAAGHGDHHSAAGVVGNRFSTVPFINASGVARETSRTQRYSRPMNEAQGVWFHADRGPEADI
jgi:FixJ family two-component response regulator